MRPWQKLGFWLPLVIVVVWGVVVIHQDTMRETAFILLMSVGLASSLNILLGYTGYVSFGHIVFFGLGGYTGFYLLSELGWPCSAMAIGGGCSALIALLVGLAVLRLRGAYFALATIGINEAARAFVSNFEPYGGATGLFVNFSAYERYGGAGEALWTTFMLLWITAMVVLLVSFLVKHSRSPGFAIRRTKMRHGDGVKAPAKTITLLFRHFPRGDRHLVFLKNGNIEPGTPSAPHVYRDAGDGDAGGMGTSGPLVEPRLSGLRGYSSPAPSLRNCTWRWRD
jgi:branched-chain amino acid transport system permease protein